MAGDKSSFRLRLAACASLSVRKQDGWTILRQVSRNTGKTLSIFLLAMVMSACRQSAQKPVTLSYFRLGWAHADVWSAGAPLSQKFTRETGIQLKDLPVPETLSTNWISRARS